MAHCVYLQKVVYWAVSSRRRRRCELGVIRHVNVTAIASLAVTRCSRLDCRPMSFLYVKLI